MDMDMERLLDDNRSEEFSDDIRIQELQSLEAIYSNTTDINYKNLTGSAIIPIRLEKDIEIILHDGNLLVSDKQVQIDLATEITDRHVRKDKIKNLPPVQLTFKVTEKYPFEEPPEFHINTTILSDSDVESLYSSLHKLWDDFKDQVLYALIDFIQEKIDNHLETLIGPVIDCGTDVEKYRNFQEFNVSEVKSQFDNETFTCDICQDDFKGANCSRFDSCGHVFCNSCLYDYFISLINTGDIDKVHCPHFECTKKFIQLKDKYLRLDGINIDTFNFNEFKANIMTPPISFELLSRILKFKDSDSSSEEMVKRYQDLFIKQQYDLISKLFPARLVSCPRTGCPEQIFRENTSDPLVICRRCKYAFCNDCHKSWHGTYYKCVKKDKSHMYSDIPLEGLDLWLESGENSKERIRLGYLYGKALIRKMANEYLMDKMFNDMLNDENQGLRKCPTCEIIIQRLDGCNKMCCSSCRTFFCNLCGCYLDHSRPYDHYKDFESPCYGRLFEGMPGLEDE